MTTLLHRTQELDLLTAALDATARGTGVGAGGGSLTVVTGGIGMGKTALLRALPELAERRGVRVLTASGAPHEQAFGYGVLSQLLTPLLPAEGSPVTPPAAPPGEPAGPSTAAGQDSELLALVAEHAERKPLLLLVDDLQWADAPSLRWLARLTGRLPRLRVTVVVALREGDPGEDEPRLHHLTGRAAAVLRLGPLSPEATADLAGARLGRPVDEDCARACHEATGGHPLLLTAILDALAAGADLGAEPQAPYGRLPDARDIRGIRPDGLRERLAVVLRGQRPPVWRFAAALAVLGEGTGEPGDPGEAAGHAHHAARRGSPRPTTGAESVGYARDTAGPGHAEGVGHAGGAGHAGDTGGGRYPGGAGSSGHARHARDGAGSAASSGYAAAAANSVGHAGEAGGRGPARESGGTGEPGYPGEPGHAAAAGYAAEVGCAWAAGPGWEAGRAGSVGGAGEVAAVGCAGGVGDVGSGGSSGCAGVAGTGKESRVVGEPGYLGEPGAGYAAETGCVGEAGAVREAGRAGAADGYGWKGGRVEADGYPREGGGVQADGCGWDGGGPEADGYGWDGGGGEDPAARLAGLDDTGRAEAVRALRRLGLLAPGPVPRFVHPVVADAVEDVMAPAEAEAVRLRAALLLHQSGQPAERAAAQLLAVSSCEEPWAQEVLRAAATAALRRTDPEAAARYLRRALLLSPPEGPSRAELLVELAMVERDFNPRAALRHFTQALLLLPEPARRARVAGRIPPFLLDDCPPATLGTVARTAAELGDAAGLTGSARRSALRLEARLGHAAVAGPAELAGTADRLRALGPVPCLDSAADRERVTVLLHGAVLAQRVTAAEAVPLAERLLQHEPATPDHVHTALPLLTDVLVAADSLTTIGPWLHTAYDRARRDRATVPRALIAVELAHLALARGDLAGARAHAAEALDLDATDWATLRTLASVVLAALEARDTALCERLLSGSPPDPAHSHLPSLRLLVRGSAAALRHDLPTALGCYLDWGRTAERAHWHNPAVAPWRSWVSALHYRMGRPGHAHDLMDEEYERAMAWGSPVAIGRAQRGRGAITGGEHGLALLRESAATLERTAHVLEQARTALLLGRRLLTAGREAEAEQRLTRARELGLTCGAPWIADRAGRALHTIAGSQGADAVAALTRTERRVAGLAAHGTSNRAIAERLEVSARAVEKHLTRAYRKLRIDGRAELVPLARLLSVECPEAATGAGARAGTGVGEGRGPGRGAVPYRTEAPRYRP
ncbi:AAA family ATPase [Streptomyces racemochromogenes]|uniref:AAA family ATPase n=1 Tax=Streptomyces racemochromogenes TaxID=67353 RepID=A0ABW7PGY6_9ACTN